MRQGQHGGGGAALGLLSPPSLLARFLPLGPGLQTLVRLMGASWAPGWSLGCGLFGLRLFSPGRGEEGFEGLIEALLHFPPLSLQLPYLLQPLEPFPLLPDLSFLQLWADFRVAGGVSRRCISCCTQASLGSAHSSR